MVVEVVALALVEVAVVVLAVALVAVRVAVVGSRDCGRGRYWWSWWGLRCWRRGQWMWLLLLLRS